ncbi:MAG: TetR/AcrR family transcriptional regulator [Microbacterium sp.]|jgi:AcrR family transcriptional regulator|nr:TetR/AcrR family transcriptional regulator [Microbacterium sp.]
MARPRRFSDDQVLDAARDLLADPAIVRPSIADISRASGVQAGSVYLRFASRDELLARLWLRAIQRFHATLFEAMDAEDPLLGAALHQSRYCRSHPTEARAMKMFGQDQLAGVGSAELQEQILHVNDEMGARFHDVIRERYGVDDPALVAQAYTVVRAIPYGLIRGFIAHAAPIPLWIDEVVRASVAAALDVLPLHAQDDEPQR